VYASGGVTVIEPFTKHVVVNESPVMGPIVLHGPPKGEGYYNANDANTLAWRIHDAKVMNRLFPVTTGRTFKLKEIRNQLSSEQSHTIQIHNNITYRGKAKQEVYHYIQEGDTLKLDKEGGHYHARLTPLCYEKRTLEHKRREFICGYNPDWSRTELEPICVRVAPEVERNDMFKFII